MENTGEQKGFTGEWIVKVHGITGPEDADRVWDLVVGALGTLEGVLPNRVEVSFDKSRWQGGDF